jgi:hypothetical protein
MLCERAAAFAAGIFTPIWPLAMVGLVAASVTTCPFG